MMKERKAFVITIFLIICVIAGGFVYKKITSKQIQNITGNLEINKEKVNEIEKREWGESEESHPFKVLPDPNEEGEVVNRTWEEIWEEYNKGHYNKEPVNIDKINKLYIDIDRDINGELVHPELSIGIEFEEGGLNDFPYWLYDEEPMYYSVSESDMEQIKESLKNHIYRHDWKYQYNNKSDGKDVYASEIDTDLIYTIVLVDEYGRMEVYEGYTGAPKDMEEFLSEMKVYDPLFDESLEENK